MSLWHSVLRTKIQILGYKNRPLIAEKGMPPYCGVCMPPLTGIKNKQHKKRRCSTGTSRKVIKKFWSGKVIWSFSWIPFFCITGCLFWGWSEKQPSNPPWNPFTGPTHPSCAQGTMCRQNSPQWRHFFQGNSPKKKWTKKLWSPLVIMKNGLRFVGFSRNCCFGWYFLLVALLPVRENTELPVLVLLMEDALMWHRANKKTSKFMHPPVSSTKKKTDFFEGYCKTLLSFPESFFSMLGKTDSFRDRNMGVLLC